MSALSAVIRLLPSSTMNRPSFASSSVTMRREEGSSSPNLTMSRANSATLCSFSSDKRCLNASRSVVTFSCLKFSMSKEIAAISICMNTPPASRIVTFQLTISKSKRAGETKIKKYVFLLKLRSRSILQNKRPTMRAVHIAPYSSSSESNTKLTTCIAIVLAA